MVKLLKHELLALFRVLAFFAIAVVVFAVAGRILLEVDFRTSDGDMTQGVLSVLFVMFYIFAICALIIAAWGLGISRFYKTLFSGEGYMTLSLPVSPTGVILAKLLSSLIAMAAATVVSTLSLCIFLVGLDASILHEIDMGIMNALSAWGAYIAAEPLIFVEQIIYFLVSLPASLLAIYACISAGQLFTTHRKLMTFLIALGVYILYQMISLYCIAPIMTAAVSVSPHLILWLQILFVSAVDVGCFFFVRYILKNKINLVL